MFRPFVGTIRFINQRRATAALEVALGVRIVMGEESIFLDAGALGSAMCRKTLAGTFEGVPLQPHRSLPVRVVIRSVHDDGGRVRLIFEGYPPEAGDPSELPQTPFIRGNVDARFDP